MNETNKTICRLCLAVGDNFTSLDVLSEEKLNVVVPELQLTQSASAAFVICSRCKTSVEEFYKLKSRFQSTFPNKNNVCLVCSMCIGGDKKAIRKDSADYLFISVLEMCLPELGQEHIDKVAMCEFCYDALRNLNFFKHKSLSVHKKINLYYKFETHKDIDLSEVLQFMSEESTNLVSISDFEIADEDDGESNSSIEEEVEANEEKNVSGSHEGDPREPHGVDNEESHGADDHQMSNASGEPLPKKKKKNKKKNVKTVFDDLPSRRFLQPHIVQSSSGMPMDEWLDIVEKIKEKKNWTSEFVKEKVLDRMKTLNDTHTWFENFTRKMNWEEFKEVLILAFPGSKDFAMNIRHVMNLNKIPKKSYVDFFNKKMNVLKQISVTDEEAVSLILVSVGSGRVNSTARFAKYKTPARLLEYFKQFDQRVSNARILRKTQPKKNKKTKICNKCLKKGHLTANCRAEQGLLKEKKRKEEYLRNINQAGMKKNNMGCYLCFAKDHDVKSCPFLNKNSQLGTLHTTINKEPEHKTEVMCSRCKEKGHMYFKCPQVYNAAKKKLESEAVLKEKLSKNAKPPIERNCNYCNQVGHFSSNCSLNPYSTPEESVPQYASEIMWQKVEGEGRPPAQKECQRCKKVGHLESNCPMTLHSNTKKQNTPKSLVFRCTLCNGVGHISLSCPSIAIRNSTIGRIHPQMEGVDGRIGRSVEVNRQLEQNCSFCKTVGHSDHNCPEKRAQLYSNRIDACAYCHSERHTSPNCPLLKPSQKPIAFERPNQASEEYTEYRSTETYSNRNSDRYDSTKAVKLCIRCNATDHDTLNCPQVRFQDHSELRSTTYNVYRSNSREVQESTRVRQCTRCGKIGHSLVECPQNIWLQQSSKTSQCTKCGKFGHQSSDCLLYRKSTETSFSRNLSRYSSNAGLSSLNRSENYSSRYRN